MNFKIASSVIFWFCMIAAFGSSGGTSVGNFKRAFQKEFDFEVRYPETWALKSSNQTLAAEESAETWVVDNAGVVANPANKSEIRFGFIRQFPAKNQHELLQQLKIRHPNLQWSEIANPDFVGYQSLALEAGAGTSTNMEYYLAEAGKVVRIDLRRNPEKNGAAETDLIVSTIRKPSLPMAIHSVTYNQQNYKPGDEACITLKVDALKAAPNPTVRLELKGELKQWMFRSQKFDPEQGHFEVCQTMTRAMPKEALFIVSASIENGPMSVSCFRDKEVLSCRSAKAEKKSARILEPVFLNDDPDTVGPVIRNFSVTPDQNSFVFDCTDESGVAFAQIDFADNATSVKKQMILFENDLKNPQHRYVVPSKLLNPGFNLIRKVTVFDKVGNVTLLYANNPSNRTYQSIFENKKSEVSNVPYVSIKRP